MSGSAAEYVLSAQGALIGAADAVGFGTPEFRVMLIGRDRANALITANHYSRKFYSASYIHLGVFIDGDLRGALQFGYAMNPASQGSIVEGTGIDEYLELNRMWLDDAAPRNSESRAISYAIKYIRRAHPKIKWIQSFADERCRLFGTVYQACNFVYCGEHASTFWTLDGEIFHNSLATRDQALSKSAARLLANIERATPMELRQFRYLFFMAPRFRRGLKLNTFPYPKPIAARLSDEPGTPRSELGAYPRGRSKIATPAPKVKTELML